MTEFQLGYDDAKFDQMLRDYDEEFMALPDLETEPHLLISKVRKHYMEYMVKLLSMNYESNQRLINKNIYLPSAIWRCAKEIEIKAAQACMVVQIYRKHICPVVKELKNDTKKGRLNRKLFDYLNKPPANYKKTQTTITTNEKEYNCQCSNKRRKLKSRSPVSPKPINKQPPHINCLNDNINTDEHNITNLATATPQQIPTVINQVTVPYQLDPQPVNFVQNQLMNTANPQQINAVHNPLMNPYTVYEQQTTSIQNQLSNLDTTSVRQPHRLSVDTQDTDEVMLQLEKLFHEEGNMSSFEDDIFDKWDTVLEENAKNNATLLENSQNVIPGSIIVNSQNAIPSSTLEKSQNIIPGSIIENHAAQIRSLDERLASLAGMITNNDPPAQQPKVEAVQPVQKTKTSGSSKWLCEEYFLKQKYFEKLDQIGECNRLKLGRIKDTIVYLFGYDSDDEGLLSPLDETPEFIVSCKERIAPWVVKLLTPYYIKGNIRGKAIFKALAKHLIRLIYQCSRYPEEYEVHSFITDFLKNHRSIKSEADFKEFKIQNI